VQKAREGKLVVWRSVGGSRQPIFSVGSTIRGHEFHYSKMVLQDGLPVSATKVQRGKGVGQGRDGVVVDNVWAGYTHVHALATTEWAAGILQAARQFASLANVAPLQ